MAGKTKPGKPVKGINIKLKMINDLTDVTGSAKDSWNPAEISDDMKAIAYIHDLADTWNPAQLNEALKYLGFATIDSWNPAIIEETKNKLVKYFLPTEASGNPVTFNTYGNLPYEVSKAEVTLLPIQDLHGYDSPWAGGDGKNKAKVTLNSGTYYNVPFIVDAFGRITINEVPSSAVAFPVAEVNLVGGTSYILSGGVDGDYRLYIQVDGTPYTSGSTESSVFTPTTSGKYEINIVATTGASVGDTVSTMIRLSTETDATFAPYSNICPISGRNSVTLTVNGDDTEITFEQTVYSGTVNVIEGGTSSTYGYIASYDGEELPGAWISDRDAYAPGTTPTTGAEVAYTLSAPDTLTTSAEEVNLINGENTLSTDGDTINITYKAILNS